LAELVEAAGLQLPLALHANYRGQKAEALITGDGAIVFRGQHFTSPSIAASAARKALGYTGSGKAATNGWAWWRFTGVDGKDHLLNELRTTTAD
jgi:hypothetical protein